MEWWQKVSSPVRRVWRGVSTRFRIRKYGILKLRHEVRACEYEDVHVMWEILQRNETHLTPKRGKKGTLWNIFGWATSAPSLYNSF